MSKREAVIAEALTWLETPFHHEARVKGAGVDCANLLIAVYAAAGVIPSIDLGHYPADWHLHRGEKLFLQILMQYADPVDTPEPGDIAMFTYGHQEAHGSIVIDWPKTIIHAWADIRKVCLSDASSGPLAKRLAGFYRVKGIE